MEAKNLRLGNLILNKKGEVERVFTLYHESINGYDGNAGIQPDDQEDFKPIPITEDWITKLGFDMVIKQGNGGQFGVYTLKGITYNTNHGWWWKHHLTVQPKYIHELQNLFFAITGTELELKTDV